MTRWSRRTFERQAGLPGATSAPASTPITGSRWPRRGEERDEGEFSEMITRARARGALGGRIEQLEAMQEGLS